jgi:hypothetical protein
MMATFPASVDRTSITADVTFSLGATRRSENSMKVDNVEVFTKGECYTSHLVSGKKHEKYVKSGNANICVGNSHNYELDIVGRSMQS